MDKVYVHATLKVRIGGYDRFCEAMAKQVPILESYGWKMVGAYNTAVGEVYNVIHIWELPDANCFFDATLKWRESPEYKAFRMVTPEVLKQEIVTMVRKTPYSP